MRIPIAIALLAGGLASASQTALLGAGREPATARQAEWREVTIPAGTPLSVVFDTTVGSDVSRVEQQVQGHLARPIVVNGVTVVPRLSRVSGIVTATRRPGKVKGRAYVGVRFTTLEPSSDEERYRIATRTIGRTAPATKKADAWKIAGPAAGGAAIGGILGGGKGALIGSAAGGGAGTAVVLSTRGQEVRYLRGSSAVVRLTAPVKVRVRG